MSTDGWILSSRLGSQSAEVDLANMHPYHSGRVGHPLGAQRLLSLIYQLLPAIAPNPSAKHTACGGGMRLHIATLEYVRGSCHQFHRLALVSFHRQSQGFNHIHM